MADFLPVVTAQQVASLLGVTDSRVRQMAGDGTLKPVYRGGRSLLFWRAEVNAHRRRTATSLVARNQPPAAEPLRLVTDTVVIDPAPRTGDMVKDKPLHVRIYQGMVAGSQRTVVLLSEPVGHGVRVLTNRIEQIAVDVAERFLGGRVSDAVWIDVIPPMGWSEREWWATAVDLRNILLTRETRAGQADWDPSWSPMTLEDLDGLLGGAPVDFFEWNSYSPSLVETWQRTGRPVEVVVDPEGIRPYVEAYLCLRSSSHRAWSVARRALAYRIHLGERSRMHRIQMAEVPLDEHDTSPGSEHPEVNTTIARQYVVPGDVVADLADVDAEDIPPARAQQDLAVLQAWLDEVDKYADVPDPRTAAAVEQAMAAQQTLMRMNDPDHADDMARRKPSAFVVTVDLTGSSWDGQYLERITWLDRDPRNNTELPLSERRWARELAKASFADRDLRFGYDFCGNLLTCVSLDLPEDEPTWILGIRWPTSYDGYPLPEGVEIVAVGASGDRPVYLARHGSLIGLLPRSRPYEGWNFGYSGGGPGQLATDIESFLAGAGVTVDETIRERVWAAVASSPQQALRIEVDVLVSPFAGEGRHALGRLRPNQRASGRR